MSVSTPSNAVKTGSGGGRGTHHLFPAGQLILFILVTFLFFLWGIPNNLKDHTHQPEKAAGYFLTGTLAAFGVGRFGSAYLMRFIAPNKLMGA